MNERQLRDDIVRIGQKLYAKGFVAGTDGNISARLTNDRYLITPSGCPKGDLNPDQLIIIDTDGKVISGDGKPSSEYKMHLLYYNELDNINAVVHAHPPVTTSYSVSGKRFKTDILPEGILVLRNLAWVEYGTPSTDDLPLNIAKYLPHSDIFVLENHGLTTISANLQDAYMKLEATEHVARINLYSELLGGAQSPGKDELSKIMKVYGLLDS
jgi:L-fuculose-phosphate aldolase